MVVLAGIIVYRDFQPLKENGAPIPKGNITFFREVDTQFMLAFPILACSFLCHFNVLPVYRSAHSLTLTIVARVHFCAVSKPKYNTGCGSQSTLLPLKREPLCLRDAFLSMWRRA